ncbi:DUF4349 domain-containing protein [Microbacterium sp.]|uniref:DUF4349 domain-containing protein n=1 Tax=Microbacterium sp. TaxID=51671 RepID=UPI002812731C|nr:DUF4349 domain-containing protein [Microbacterium sp.]
MSDTKGIELPPLSDERLTAIERDVLAAIAEEPRRSAPPRRRGRVWATALGVAAAFAAGALITPSVLDAVQGVRGASGTAATSEVAPETGDMAGGGVSGADGLMGADADVATDSSEGSVAEPGTREIITTAQVELRVTDVQRAADGIAALAAEHGGFVESADIGASRGAEDASVPAPPRQPGTAWISIRIAADDLDEVIAALGDDGEVIRSSISRQDVTSTAVDLRARVDASRASVARLTELMAKSGSVADLIAAETALSERQAQLESYEQELKRLDEQVSLSTVTVQLTERTEAAEADPAGFADGLLAGWNGLVSALNGLVIAVGFLLPWLAIASVVVLIVWLVRRRRRASRAPKGAESH